MKKRSSTVLLLQIEKLVDIKSQKVLQKKNFGEWAGFRNFPPIPDCFPLIGYPTPVCIFKIFKA